VRDGIKEFGAIVIRSGAASSYKTIEDFVGTTQENPRIDFVSFQESDRYSGCQFVIYAARQGYEPSDMAILSEGRQHTDRFRVRPPRPCAGSWKMWRRVTKSLGSISRGKFHRCATHTSMINWADQKAASARYD
jgi:hypothetical protein